MNNTNSYKKSFLTLSVMFRSYSTFMRVCERESAWKDIEKICASTIKHTLVYFAMFFTCDK